MSQAASQAAAFYREVAQHQEVWTVRDVEGFPAPLNPDGVRVQPFWSSRARVANVLEHSPAYAGFEAISIPWQEFRDRWLPGLARDEILVGVNWSGVKATGYDVEPDAVGANVEYAMEGSGAP